MGSLADVYVRIRGDTTVLKGDTEKGAREAGQSAGQAFHGSFTGMIKQAAATAGALLGGSAIYNLGKMGIQAAADMQQAQVAFTTLIGNAQTAQKFLQDLKNFAAATPFELPGLIDDARLLMGVGVAANDVIPTLTAWGNAAGALGISSDRFHSAMLAVSQSMGAGKINAQDMNQIINAGIPIWKLMSEATGKTVPELRKLSEQGKLLSTDVLPLLERQMQKDYGGAMAAQSKTLTGVWSTFMDTLRIGMADALDPLIPALSQAIPAAATVLQGALSAGSKAMADFIKMFGTGWRDGARGAAGEAQQLGHAAHEVFDWLKTDGVAIVKEFGGALVTARDVIADTVRWFNEHRNVALTLAIAIGALVLITKAHAAAMAVEAAGGIAAYLLKMNLVTAATKVWTAVQWLLNLAMDANPIGLIIIAVVALVAVFVLLWTHSEGFRNFFIGMWNAIWSFMKMIGAWFAGPFADFFVAAGKALAAPFIWLWHNGIEPVWNFLQAMGRWFAGPFVDGIVAGAKMVAAPFLWLWHNVVEPAWAGIQAAIDVVIRIVVSAFNLWAFIMRNTVGAAVLWLWHTVIEPAFRAVAALAMWLWNNAIVPAFHGIVAAGRAVGDFFVWLWNNAIMPAVHGIADLAMWLWHNALVPAFNGIMAAVHAVGAAAMWLWNNAIEPAMHGIGAAASWMWNSVLSPTFNAVMGAVHWLRDGFRDAFSAIGGFISGAFSGAASIVKGAMNGVIGVVNGAIGGINSIIDAANKVPGVDFPHIPQIPRLATGGRITKGGRVLLGEAGAEVVDLPPGAAVYPHGSRPRDDGDGGRVEQLLQDLIDAVERVAPGVGEEINGTSTTLRRLARAGV